MAVLGTAAVIAGSLALAFSAPAGADTGYPGTTTTTMSGNTNPSGGGTSNGPCVSTVTVRSGTSVVVVLTGCAPNSTFSIAIAGVATGLTVASDPAGNVTLTNAVTGDPFLSVNGSKPVSTIYGTNTVSLTNTSGCPGGTEYVIIPNVLTAALSTGSSGTGSGGTLAFTGADLLALIVGALFLLAVGTLLVVFTRRRANQQQVA
ncbi:MAG TPA: hypothetical protein VGG43_00080 [Acidimicrobiales bacterium]